jgi:hypothetical protein
MAEYRNGNDKENHVRKVAGVHKVSDVTLKRGIVNFTALGVDRRDPHRRAGGAKDGRHRAARRGAQPVQHLAPAACIPMKYTGPTLAGKGGGDVALEEVVLAAEGFEIQA